MAQMKVGVKIAWVTGGLLFASNIIGLVCNKRTGKNQAINSAAYNYLNIPKHTFSALPVQQKIPDRLKSVAKVIQKKKIKSSSKDDIYDYTNKTPTKKVPRKISEREIMYDMNKYFPDRTLSVEFVTFYRADIEVTSVKNKITSILRKNGYKNIEEKFRIKMGAVLPEKIVLDSVPGKHSICFEIPPAN
jgi:hypothetical protein